MSTLAELAIEGRLRAVHWRILIFLGSIAGASDLAVLGLSEMSLRQGAEHLVFRGLAEQLPGTFTWRLTDKGRALFQTPAVPPPAAAPQPAPQPAPQAASKPVHSFLLRPPAQQKAALASWLRVGARLDLRAAVVAAVVDQRPAPAEALDYAERFAARLAENEESARRP